MIAHDCLSTTRKEKDWADCVIDRHEENINSKFYRLIIRYCLMNPRHVRHVL